MKVLEIAFVGYTVTDLKRAQSFYEGTLGLTESRRWGDENTAWVEYDIGPGTLAITNMIPGRKPSHEGATMALEMEDFDEAISQLKAEGVKFVWGPEESPVCNMAVVLDPDGNALVIHKRKDLAPA